LCLVNNANRQADNIVITRCLFICLCPRVRAFSVSSCPSRRVRRAPRWRARVRPYFTQGVGYKYPSSRATATFTAVRSRYFATALPSALCVTDSALARTCGRLDTRPPESPITSPASACRAHTRTNARTHTHTHTYPRGVAADRIARTGTRTVVSWPTTLRPRNTRYRQSTENVSGGGGGHLPLNVSMSDSVRFKKYLSVNLQCRKYVR